MRREKETTITVYTYPDHEDVQCYLMVEDLVGTLEVVQIQKHGEFPRTKCAAICRTPNGGGPPGTLNPKDFHNVAYYSPTTR